MGATTTYTEPSRSVQNERKKVATAQQHDGPRILVIEDDAVTRKYVQRYFSKQGIDIETCDNLQQLRNDYFPRLDTFDIVTLDLRMRGPQWNGVEGLPLLKEMYQRSPKPIYLIWTAFGASDEAKACLANGAELILCKKGDIESIAQLLKSLGAAHARLMESGQYTTFDDM